MKQPLKCALTCLCLLAGLALPGHAATASQNGSATATALKDDGSGKTSMMSGMLSPNCSLEQSDAGLFATLTFQNASIMLVPVKAADVRPVTSYADGASYPAQDLGGSGKTWSVKVRVPSLEQDTLVGMQAMGSERKILLHLQNVVWEPTTTAATTKPSVATAATATTASTAATRALALAVDATTAGNTESATAIRASLPPEFLRGANTETTSETTTESTSETLPLTQYEPLPDPSTVSVPTASAPKTQAKFSGAMVALLAVAALAGVDIGLALLRKGKRAP